MKAIERFLFALLASFFGVAVWASEATLTAKPKASISGMNGSTVTVRLTVEGEYACMGRRVYWPDDTRSYHEADCDPDNPTIHDSESWRRRFGPGEYQVCVGLDQPDGNTRKKVCDTFAVN